MKVIQLIELFQTIAPFELQESYDNSGLLTGQVDLEISGIMVCLDMTEDVIDEAISKKCNLIIGHHPIIFQGLKRINGNNYVERVIIKAIKNDLALFAIHTNLDNVLYQGVNQRIAQQLDLSEVQILIPRSNIPEGFSGLVGTGCVGNLPSPMKLNECLLYLKQKMQTNCIRYAGSDQKTIRKIAICGGSGSSFLKAAIQHQADLYLSADFKYHEFFEADDKIIIADIGHYESEQFTIDLIIEIIQNNFPNFAVLKTSKITNPIKYYT
jgi:dinuclear metal center YbgI/SA1388 family protein